MDHPAAILSKIASDALHQVYILSVSKPNLPYTFFKLHSIMTTENDKHTSDLASSVKESFLPLMRTSTMLLKTKDLSSLAFVHHILMNWSALILEGSSQHDCLREMVQALDNFLSTSFQRWKQNSSPRLFKKNSLPGLNGKTYTALFELLLHMISASFALSKPHRIKKSRPSNAHKKGGPYGEVIWPLEIYGKLLSTYQSNHIFFPQRFVFTAIKSSSLMIQLTEHQLQQCVQWRNSQRPQGIGIDSAAAYLLQPLINSVASHIGSMNSLSHELKVQLKRGSNYKHTKAIAGLLYKCEGVKETLQGICQTQSLHYPNDFTPLQATRASPKRKWDGSKNDNSAGRKKQKGNTKMSPKRNTRSHNKTKNNLASPSVLELLPELDQSKDIRHDSLDNIFYENIDSEGSEQDVDNSDANESLESNDDDSFGVVGDWAV